jgi:molecular chaperone GrpE
MRRSRDTSPNTDNPEILADITDQTLADEQPGDVPTVDIPTVETTGAPEPDENGDELPTLQAQIDEARREAESKHDAYLRALADFANYKRRTQEESARQRDIVREEILTGLLPVIDNFERALASAQTTQDYDKLVSGVQAILRQLQDFLAREGVTGIEAVGQPFDPNFHNAVLRHETTEYPENTIVEELQKGYTLGKRVLRPSMVKVAAGTE